MKILVSYFNQKLATINISGVRRGLTRLANRKLKFSHRQLQIFDRKNTSVQNFNFCL